MALAAALVAGLTLPALSPAAPASAAPAGNGPWHTLYEEPFTDTIQDYCDVPGLTVTYTYGGVLQVRTSRTLGVDGFPYETSFYTAEELYTNVATGETVTDAFAAVSQDVRLIDNGDGTFTRHVSNKGHHVLYSDDGVVLVRSAGIFGYNVVYNYAGTPSDPSDDFKVGRPFNFKDEGLKIDYCAVIVGAIG
ncbi:hypothetical protein [Humibacillus xanthopallidus]|uniref:hypothetical protein n=1 Tax=Humibacillus xanthopallidus TaxID=412689 RepID=UPI00384DC2BB